MTLTEFIYISGLGLVVLMAIAVLIIIRQYRNKDDFKKRHGLPLK